jgi:hypothetical protein
MTDPTQDAHLTTAISRDRPAASLSVEYSDREPGDAAAVEQLARQLAMNRLQVDRRRGHDVALKRSRTRMA